MLIVALPVQNIKRTIALAADLGQSTHMLAHSYILAPVLQSHCMYVVHKYIQAGKTFIHIKSNKLIVSSPYFIQGLALQNLLWQFGIKNIKW